MVRVLVPIKIGGALYFLY